MRFLTFYNIIKGLFEYFVEISLLVIIFFTYDYTKIENEKSSEI